MAYVKNLQSHQVLGEKEGHVKNVKEGANVHIKNTSFFDTIGRKRGVKRKVNEIMSQIILRRPKLFTHDKKTDTFEARYAPLGANAILQHDKDDSNSKSSNNVNTNKEEEKGKNKDVVMYQAIFYVLSYICLGNNIMGLYFSYHPSTQSILKDKAVQELQKSLHISAI
eukprot:CAMPEP_0203680334 /NCGR_PEP_ID=MMETSP0090-20130426/38857_1 /ASSEMBLY_ACC=CAM_ASM_001088 /TAXON_ID=426623 /ORGANISM="Chaetoceros affinis, Strain CCMP159" /LENGTH=167 /DNA_ID=CAMNT_0050548351 /DNA_START=207 /DNA_END=708 /DNA_ORIENTATION=+